MGGRNTRYGFSEPEDVKQKKRELDPSEVTFICERLLSFPVSLAVVPGGRLLVTDCGRAGKPGLQVINELGAPVNGFMADSPLPQLWGIEVLRSGSIVTFSQQATGNDPITGQPLGFWGCLSTPDGHTHQLFAPVGRGLGEMLSCCSILVDKSDNIICLDSQQLRLQIFDNTGKHLREHLFGQNGNFDFPQTIALRPKGGELVALDGNLPSVKTFDFVANQWYPVILQGGGLLTHQSPPLELAFDAEDRLFVLLQFATIRVYGSNYRFLLSFPVFPPPVPYGRIVTRIARNLRFDYDDGSLLLADDVEHRLIRYSKKIWTENPPSSPPPPPPPPAPKTAPSPQPRLPPRRPRKGCMPLMM